jgi:small ligand-binding sensory domain FIST
VHWNSTLSTEPRLAAALREAAERARASRRDAPDLAFLFLGGYSGTETRKAGEVVLEQTGARRLIGCTAGGVVGGGREVEQRASVSLTLAWLPDVQVHAFHVDADQYPDGDAPPTAWHERIGAAPEPTPAFVVLPDPFTAEAPRLLSGLDYAYPRSIKVGGLASGASAPQMNWLYLDGTSTHTGAVGVALSGAVAVDTVVAQGCRPVGSPGRITKAQRYYLIEVEGKRALDFVQEQVDSLSDAERELARSSLFLGIAMDPFRDAPPEAGDFLIRNFLGVDPEKGVVAVGEELSTGRLIQLHVRDASASSEDLRTVLRRSVARRGGASPSGALLFSCLGRGEHLYGEPDHDSKLFRSVVGEVPLGGFFCSGEIGPVGGETFLHGYTSSFGLFRPPLGA